MNLLQKQQLDIILDAVSNKRTINFDVKIIPNEGIVMDKSCGGFYYIIATQLGENFKSDVLLLNPAYEDHNTMTFDGLVAYLNKLI